MQSALNKCLPFNELTLNNMPSTRCLPVAKRKGDPVITIGQTFQNPLTSLKNTTKTEVQIIIQQPNGTSLEVAVGQTEEMEKVKERIEGLIGVPTFRQELHDGSDADFLKDNRTVADLTTEGGSHVLLHLIAKPAPPLKTICSTEMSKFSLLMIRGLEVYKVSQSKQLLKLRGSNSREQHSLCVLHMNQSFQNLHFGKRKDGTRNFFNVHTEITRICACPNATKRFQIRTNLPDPKRKGKTRVLTVELPTAKSRNILVAKLCNLIHYVKVAASSEKVMANQLAAPFRSIPSYVEEILNDDPGEPIYETEGGFV
jgi:hypothetical protein